MNIKNTPARVWWLIVIPIIAIGLITSCKSPSAIKYFGPGGQDQYPALNPTNSGFNIVGQPVIPNTRFPIPLLTNLLGQISVDTNQLNTELSQISRAEGIVQAAQPIADATGPWAPWAAALTAVAGYAFERWRHGITQQQLVATALQVMPTNGNPNPFKTS